MKKFYEILTKFANDHTLAKDIECKMTEHYKSYEAKDGGGARFSDVVLLSQIVDGANQFCFYLESNNYKIVKGK